MLIWFINDGKFFVLFVCCSVDTVIRSVAYWCSHITFYKFNLFFWVRWRAAFPMFIMFFCLQDAMEREFEILAGSKQTKKKQKTENKKKTFRWCSHREHRQWVSKIKGNGSQQPQHNPDEWIRNKWGWWWYSFSKNAKKPFANPTSNPKRHTPAPNTVTY